MTHTVEAVALRTSKALREAAIAMEHECEFNVNETLGWSRTRQRDNNLRITWSRELHARADAAAKYGRVT